MSSLEQALFLLFVLYLYIGVGGLAYMSRYKPREWGDRRSSPNYKGSYEEQEDRNWDLWLSGKISRDEYLTRRKKLEERERKEYVNHTLWLYGKITRKEYKARRRELTREYLM